MADEETIRGPVSGFEDDEAAGDLPTRKFQKELNAGLVSLLLIGLIDREHGPMYGYQIGKRLEARAGRALPVKQGTLYPVLRSLETAGLLASDIEPSVAGPPRRWYRITPAGREALREWRQIWSGMRDLVDSVVGEGAGDERNDNGDGGIAPAGEASHA